MPVSDIITPEDGVVVDASFRVFILRNSTTLDNISVKYSDILLSDPIMV